jgi:hypothetical protein
MPVLLDSKELKLSNESSKRVTFTADPFGVTTTFLTTAGVLFSIG